jgi:hypothetical protein
VNRPRYWFVLGPVPNTTLTRYAIVAGDGNTVLSVQVSRPDDDLLHIEPPTHIRWRRVPLAEQLAGVQIKTWRINEQPVGHNGEQPRKPVWRRAGRRAAAEVA